LLSSRFRFGPFGFDPGFLFEAVQRGVEGTLLNLQHFPGDLLDALGDGPAVLRLERDSFENQQVQRSLHEIVRLFPYSDYLQYLLSIVKVCKALGERVWSKRTTFSCGI
jgi:hypothetical protein